MRLELRMKQELRLFRAGRKVRVLFVVLGLSKQESYGTEIGRE